MRKYCCILLLLVGVGSGSVLLAQERPVPIALTRVTVTTDASGDASVLTLVQRGRVVIIWYKDGFDDTADFTITVNATGEGLWTESNVTATKLVAPTKPVQDQVGVDRTQFDYIWAVGSEVKIVIAQGGNAKSAVFEIWIY